MFNKTSNRSKKNQKSDLSVFLFQLPAVPSRIIHREFAGEPAGKKSLLGFDLLPDLGTVSGLIAPVFDGNCLGAFFRRMRKGAKKAEKSLLTITSFLLKSAGEKVFARS